MKPVCVPCRRFFRVKKTGFYFVEGMPLGNNVKPGNEEPQGWGPYKVWSGDLWECQGCGARIVSGVGMEPLAVQHEARFDEILQRVHADQLQVNDC